MVQAIIYRYRCGLAWREPPEVFEPWQTVWTWRSRGGRPPGFDAADYRNRNVIERRFGHLKQWRGLATRYDKLATVCRAAAVLNAVIAWTRRLSDTL
jgi:transposase